MSAPVFAAVLIAAFLHAVWNALLKGGADRTVTAVLVAAGAALVALVLLPFLPRPASPSWSFIATSAALQVTYFALLSIAYRSADLSVVYPVMRGTPPLLVGAGSVFILAERLSPTAWAGLGAIVAGVAGMALAARAVRHRTGVVTALANAFVIAAYTLVDAAGVRRSGAPFSYTLWLFLLTGVSLLGWGILRRRAEIRVLAVTSWSRGLLGGAGACASYGIALWAMTQAPVAMVAALRETSILFGLGLSVVFLRERPGFARAGLACLIAAGVMLLKFG